MTLELVILSLSKLKCAESEKFSMPDYPSGDMLGDPFSNGFDENDESRTFDSFGSAGDSFVKKRLYNTSIALTASMFTYYLPSQTEAGTITDLVNQAVSQHCQLFLFYIQKYTLLFVNI